MLITIWFVVFIFIIFIPMIFGMKEILEKDNLAKLTTFAIIWPAILFILIAGIISLCISKIFTTCYSCGTTKMHCFWKFLYSLYRR